MIPGLDSKYYSTGWAPDGTSIYVASGRGQQATAKVYKVNITTGKWADFASGDKGGDVISLAAFLFRLAHAEAARRLADMLGVR